MIRAARVCTRLLAIASLLFGGARSARAQSEPSWEGSFGRPGPNDLVLCTAVFDDGSGPALYAGGRFTQVDSQIISGVARWDGAHWTPLSSGVDGTVNALVVHNDGDGAALYAGGDFQSAGDGAVSRIARWDGKHWSSLGTGVSNTVLVLASFDDGAGPALYAGGWFTNAGGKSAGHIARWKDSQWAPLGTGLNGAVHALCAFDDGSGPALYAGGEFYKAGNIDARLVARWDGAGWAPLSYGIRSGTVHSMTVFPFNGKPVLFVGGFFSGVDDNDSWINLAWWDGQSWVSGLFWGTVTNLSVLDIGQGPSLFRCTEQGIARFNGTDWDQPFYLSNAWYFTLAVFDTDDGPAIHVGGDLPTSNIFPGQNFARLSGHKFLPLGEGGGLAGGIGPTTVGAAAAFDDGHGPRLYAAGDFTLAGQVRVAEIAAWDGAQWSDVGGGLNAPARALAVHDDGSGPALYVGGKFVTAGGKVANNIARWNGSAWSPLGAGTNGAVNALCSHDDGSGPILYAGGEFTKAGGQPSTYLASWDGKAWHTIDTGMNKPVYALASFDADGPDSDPPLLYVGGAFTTVGGLKTGRIASWSGQVWRDLGIGCNGSVYALATFDDGLSDPPRDALFVGGDFTQSGIQSNHSFARWGGKFWYPTGDGGVSGSAAAVYALAVADPDGAGPMSPALFAGGDFTDAGISTAAGIAAWADQSWSPLSGGVAGGAVLALAPAHGPLGPALFAGGSFTSAESAPSFHIARWGCPPTPCPADLTGDSVLDLFDFLAFVTLFNAGDPRADFSGDGVLDMFDFLDFVNAFNEGC